MKFSIERAALLKAVSQAQSVVERRNTIPILANVLIEAEGSDVSFRATDLDIEVVDKAPAQVEQAGSTTVSAITLHEIVRKLPDGALVTLTSDSDTCLDCRFKFPVSQCTSQTRVRGGNEALCGFIL